MAYVIVGTSNSLSTWAFGPNRRSDGLFFHSKKYARRELERLKEFFPHISFTLIPLERRAEYTGEEDE